LVPVPGRVERGVEEGRVRKGGQNPPPQVPRPKGRPGAARPSPAIKVGQVWAGEHETRIIRARPFGLVYFDRLGTQGALRALEDHATYVPYGPAFCSEHAFREWLRLTRASLEKS